MVPLARGAPLGSAGGPLPLVLPRGWLAGLHGVADPAALSRAHRSYFAEAGAFVFGSGLAIVPFLHGGVVSSTTGSPSGSSSTRWRSR